MRWTLRLQILVPFVLLSLGVIVATSVITVATAIRQIEQERDEQLQAEAQTLAIANFPLNDAVLQRLKVLSGAEVVVLLQGQIQASTLPGLAAKQITPASGTELEWQGQVYRLARAQQQPPVGERELVLLRPLRSVWEAQSQLVQAVTGLCLVAAVVVLLISAFLARRVVRRLKLIQDQDCDPALRRVIGEVLASIESGSSLSEALAMHPRAFNRLYVQMVKAGELSGALDVVLARLGTFMEKAQRLKSRVTSAMVCPAAVLCVAGAVVVLLMVVLVPKFEEIFGGLMNGRPLPEFTMLIINLSRMMQHHVVALLGGFAALVVGVKMLLGTPPGRAMFDRLKLRLPGVGPVIRKAIVARVSRTLGTLLSSGVPIFAGAEHRQGKCGKHAREPCARGGA